MAVRKRHTQSTRLLQQVCIDLLTSRFEVEVLVTPSCPASPRLTGYLIVYLGELVSALLGP